MCRKILFVSKSGVERKRSPRLEAVQKQRELARQKLEKDVELQREFVLQQQAIMAVRQEAIRNSVQDARLKAIEQKIRQAGRTRVRVNLKTGERVKEYYDKVNGWHTLGGKPYYSGQNQNKGPDKYTYEYPPEK